MVVFYFITRQMELNCFHRKSFTLLICIIMVSQEIKESPTVNHLQCWFFWGCQIRHKFILQKLVCEFINTCSCHSECTTRNTLILTPNVNSHGLLIRITTDKNVRYMLLFNSFPAMWFGPINVASPINTVNVYIIWL